MGVRFFRGRNIRGAQEKHGRPTRKKIVRKKVGEKTPVGDLAGGQHFCLGPRSFGGGGGRFRAQRPKLFVFWGGFHHKSRYFSPVGGLRNNPKQRL